MPTVLNNKKPKIYAFIDSQNLNLSLKNDIVVKGQTKYKGWKLNFEQFFIYLRDVHRVSKAFLFIGYKSGNEPLYNRLQKYGYVCIFKPTLDIKGVVKGNCDAELVLHSMIEYSNYDKAIIVSGDGDFYCLIEYLESNGKLGKVLIPNKLRYSSLLSKFSPYHLYVSKLKSRLEQK